TLRLCGFYSGLLFPWVFLLPDELQRISGQLTRPGESDLGVSAESVAAQLAVEPVDHRPGLDALIRDPEADAGLDRIEYLLATRGRWRGMDAEFLGEVLTHGPAPLSK